MTHRTKADAEGRCRFALTEAPNPELIKERKNQMKRIIALVLALVLVFALVGCGDKGPQIVHVTLDAADSEAILAAAGIQLPPVEEAAGANTTLRWLSWYDSFHNYDEDEIVNTGFFTFSEKYGGDVEWIECDYFERLNDLATLILSEDPPDFTPTGTNATATYPMSCMKGQYQAVDPYIDYDDPLWQGMKETADYFVLGGQHYNIVIDLAVANVIPYNTRVIAEWGFDDPAELYYNDEWTWDVFYEMCEDFSDGDENRYALDGYAYAGALVESTGQQMLQIDENGIFYSNLDSPEIERAENLIYDIAKNDLKYHEGTSMWALRNNATFGAGMKEGDCLFYPIGISFFTDTVDEISAIWGDVAAGELMFAPMPRDPQGDGNYYICCAIDAYAIVKGAANPEGVALLASCDRFKVIDPTVIDIDAKQLRETYLWNDDMMAMREECYNIAVANPRIDLTGDLPSNLNDVIGRLGNDIIRSVEPATWAQIKESNREAFEYYIAELNADIAEFNETGEAVTG